MPTETSTTNPDTLHEANGPVTDPVATPAVGANHIVTPAPESLSASEPDDIDYDAADFAAALENFDREQAEDKAAASAAMEEDKVITGTVVKITDKYVVVDIGLKSEGLIPMEQVLDHTGEPKLAVGDAVEVVVEREDHEGGYLVSYEKAQRHRLWDQLEKAAADKTPVTGTVLSRVKGGLTVDIGVKAFLPGSQV
jgi:small subunit ribosomal protein S1